MLELLPKNRIVSSGVASIYLSQPRRIALLDERGSHFSYFDKYDAPAGSRMPVAGKITCAGSKGAITTHDGSIALLSLSLFPLEPNRNRYAVGMSWPFPVFGEVGLHFYLGPVTPIAGPLCAASVLREASLQFSCSGNSASSQCIRG